MRREREEKGKETEEREKKREKETTECQHINLNSPVSCPERRINMPQISPAYFMSQQVDR